ncbi:ABC transporter substrate-binding protein [Phytoactinopolyspora endophytica]|uniref:ABC transporter substrate-binding protein n=1 Tax=Phytoactinopolyspora endophytica TaxID=1642495 RepID=UPI0013ED005C|nr:ABC transporter substrate-binding protein [Phytoactinopolyspora endophytica]
MTTPARIQAHSRRSTRSPSRLSGPAVCATLLAVLAGCGGSDDSARAAGDDTGGSTTTEEPTDDGQDSGPGNDDGNGESGFDPVSLDNCGVEVTADHAPQRAVTMNQSATEVMLALGLEERISGTAYLDDEILPEFADAYAGIHVLSDEYPSREALLDIEPDAVYGAYPSAFQPETAGNRSELHDVGIATYLSPSACPDKPSDEPLEIETVWQEIRDVGAIFGASDAADALVEDQQAELGRAIDSADDVSSTTVVWWDGGSDAPSVGACCGAPGMIMDAAGVENAFADVDGSWADVSWEQVAERNPDVIVLVDADWSTAEEKRATIESTPGVQELPAVAHGQFVELSFSATTPGVRNVSAVVDLIDGVEELR